MAKIVRINPYADPETAAINADWIKRVHVGGQKVRHINPYADPKTAAINADWIKYLRNGKAQEEDLAAHDMLSASSANRVLHSLIAKGGKGSGNFGHAGRPGKRGGSAPSGFSYMRRGLKEFERVEGDIVVEQHGQLGRPKDGITREQFKRYFDRLNAVKNAWYFRYNDGTSAAENVNQRVADGFTKVYRTRGGHVKLKNPETGATQLYQRGVEIRYIKALFSLDDLKRNY